MNVVIIGGVAAGTKAAAKLLRKDRSLDVTIYTKDSEISYAGCGLPYYVGGSIESREELIVNTPEKFSGLTGTKVVTEAEATKLDAGAKTVTLRRGGQEVVVGVVGEQNGQRLAGRHRRCGRGGEHGDPQNKHTQNA